MGIRTRLAVLACKTSNAVLRRMGRGGTNLPGKIALKIDKDILKELSRGVKVTVVTGTNGKTTTSRRSSRHLKKPDISTSQINPVPIF